MNEGRRARGVIATVGVLTLLTTAGRLALIWFAPMDSLDAAVPDDGYLSLVISRSIGFGHGPRFEGVLTNGFQPAYVFVMAFLAHLYFDTPPETVARLDTFARIGLSVATLFSALLVPLAASIVSRITAGDRLATVLVALIFALHPALWTHGMNALETSMALCCLLAIWRIALDLDFGTSSRWLLAGLGGVLGVGFLARVDLLAVGPYFAVVSVAYLVRSRDVSRFLRANAAVLIPFGIFVAAWCVYSYTHTGAIIPTSGEAARYNARLTARLADRSNYVRSSGAVLVSIINNTPWFVLVGVPFLATMTRGDEPVVSSFPWRKFALPASFSGILIVLYGGHVFATHHFPRYLIPVGVTLIVAVVVAASHALREHRNRRLVFLVAGSAACVAFWFGAPVVDDPSLSELVTTENDPEYRKIGMWARERFPADTVVGSGQSGGLAYWAPELEVVNLDGVVSPPALEALREKRILRYMLDRDVEYIVDWELGPVKYQDRSRLDFDAHFERVEMKQVETWGQDWRLYRRRPDR